MQVLEPPSSYRCDTGVALHSGGAPRLTLNVLSNPSMRPALFLSSGLFFLSQGIRGE